MAAIGFGVMSIGDEMAGFEEAFRCECGHYIPKYIGGGILSLSPALSFYNCCPKCGGTKDKIKLVTGKWKYKRVVYGRFWPFRKVVYEHDTFEESTIDT